MVLGWGVEGGGRGGDSTGVLEYLQGAGRGAGGSSELRKDRSVGCWQCAGATRLKG